MTRALVASVVLLVAACGGSGGEEGTAALWITRDRGSQVLATADVPAGLTVMQALRREADVQTRYGGRFVQSIDGIAGSLQRGEDWFYFVNGIEADVGAAEYRLRDGDIAWWDYRRWQGARDAPVVVGAFPEPFVHGYAGKTRPAAVRYDDPADAGAARAIGRLIGAETVARTPTRAPADANLFVVAAGGSERFHARLRGSSTAAGSPVVFTLRGDAARLARDPELARYRYEGLP